MWMALISVADGPPAGGDAIVGEWWPRLLALVPILLLVVQAALAVIGLRELLRRVIPALSALEQPELISDVWVPLAVVAPLLFLAGRVEMTVRGVGWVPIGGPVCVGALTAGTALLAARGRGSEAGVRPRALASWAAAGLVLLSLGAAGDLTIWAGQVAFALAAVLLWMNTPIPQKHAQPELSHGHHRVGLGMLAALLCATGQGIIVLFTEGTVTAVSVAMMVAYAAAVGAGAAATAGAQWAMRIGGWSATIGMLLGVGIVSFTHLAPQIVSVMTPGGGAVDSYVAHSMGLYALEGMILLLLPTLCLIALRTDRAAQRVLGAAVLALVASLVAWRVARV